MCFGYGPADARDGGTEFGVRRQDAVVAMAMDSRGRYETSEPLEKLNRREHEFGTAVGRGPGQPIDEPRLRRAEGDDTAGGVSSSPAMYRDDFDILFVGEAERTWPRFIEDLRAGQHQSEYRETEAPSLTESPAPQWKNIADLLQVP